MVAWSGLSCEYTDCRKEEHVSNDGFVDASECMNCRNSTTLQRHDVILSLSKKKRRKRNKRKEGRKVGY